VALITEMILYSPKELTNLRDQVLALTALLGAKKAHEIHRVDCAPSHLTSNDLRESGGAGQHRESTLQSVAAEEIPDVLLPTGLNKISFAGCALHGGTPYGARIEQDVQLRIAPSIRDSAIPCQISLVVGTEVLSRPDPADWTKPERIARARFQLCIFGYGLPTDYRRMEDLFFELPTVVELRTGAERIVGGLSQLMRWSC